MKKITVLLLAMAMVLSLAACNFAELAAQLTPSADPAVVMGSITEDRYTNTLFGFTFQLPEDWAFATREEMAQLAGVSVDTYEETAVAEQLSARQTVMTMQAWNAEGLPNVNLNVQFIGGGTQMTMDAYTEMVATQMPAAMETSGAQIKEIETRKVSFAGEERLGIAFQAEYETGTFWQFSYYMIVDGYLATFVFTGNSIEEIEALLPNFQPIGE